MAEITRRRVGELQRGVFKILLNFPDGLPAKELLERLESVVPPTDFEKSDYPKSPGVRRFEKIVRFATVFEGCDGRTSVRTSRLICQDIEGRYP
jgi:restriction system protein